MRILKTDLFVAIKINILHQKPNTKPAQYNCQKYNYSMILTQLDQKKLIKQIIPNSSDIAIRIQDLRQNMNKLTNQKGIYEVQMTIAMIIRN